MLIILITLLGLGILAAIILVIIIADIVFVFAVPHYAVTKRTKVEYGSYSLEELKVKGRKLF
jgi:hypothetical protein